MPDDGSKSGVIPALGLHEVSKSFADARGRLSILDGASVSIKPGEMVALVGPSGAGKSTLLHIAGLLDRPDSGEVAIGGYACAKASDRMRTRLRRHAIGFIYQFHHLLPEFTALENISIPQRVGGQTAEVAMERAAELIEMVGLSERATHRPAALSGGEQQRIAIARALANSPLLLLADEPTGNLDPKTAGAVFEVMRTVVSETKLGALVATHNLDMARSMDRIVTLSDGQIIDVTE